MCAYVFDKTILSHRATLCVNVNYVNSHCYVKSRLKVADINPRHSLKKFIRRFDKRRSIDQSEIENKRKRFCRTIQCVLFLENYGTFLVLQNGINKLWKRRKLTSLFFFANASITDIFHQKNMIPKLLLNEFWPRSIAIDVIALTCY